jgi:hypothetical protein
MSSLSCRDFVIYRTHYCSVLMVSLSFFLLFLLFFHSCFMTTILITRWTKYGRFCHQFFPSGLKMRINKFAWNSKILKETFKSVIGVLAKEVTGSDVYLRESLVKVSLESRINFVFFLESIRALFIV